MYIYASHMGGLFTADEPLEWEVLYCETCGDSDTEIGRFDENDPMSAWKALKPNDYECIGCKEEDDTGDVCDTCTKYKDNPNSYFDLLYVMQFLQENFRHKHPVFVHILCRDKEDSAVFADFSNGYNRPALPSSFCLQEEMAEKVAKALARNMACQGAEEMSEIQLQKREKKKDGSVHLTYGCTAKHCAEDGEDWWVNCYNYGWAPEKDMPKELLADAKS